MSSGLPGWSRHRLKFATEINKSVLPDGTDSDFEFDYVDISRVSQGLIDPEPQVTVFSKAASRARRLARPGDTIVSTVRTYLRAVAEVPESEMPQVFSTGFAVIEAKPETMHPRFLTYFLQSTPFVERVVADSIGVSYPAINASNLAAYDFWAPPIEQQGAIADFLDRETAQIDAMIDAQEELVTRLRERRTAVVTHLVTSEINPEQHQRIRHLASSARDSLIAGPFGSDLKASDMDGDFADVLDQGFVLGSRSAKARMVDKETFERLRRFEVRTGDILISSRGTIGRVGVVGTLTNPAIIHPCLLRLRLNHEMLLAEYFEMLANETPLLRDQLLLASNATTIEVIYTSTLKDARVPVPTVALQHRMVNQVRSTCSRLDQSILESERLTGLLGERREALITAAVTGRIDPETGIERICSMTEKEAS